ncbi:MAG: hypothetical protein OHK005_14630 [Candidatus Methylacidiphilales bacterium]
MTTQVLVWLHGDSLSEIDPAARRYPDAPKIFIFDEPWLREVRPSFKRLFFLFEGAMEVGAEIRLGYPAEEVLEAVREQGVERVAVTRSDAPRFDEWIRALQNKVDLEVVEPDPWIRIPEAFPLRRFTPFWKKLGASWS